MNVDFTYKSFVYCLIVGNELGVKRVAISLTPLKKSGLPTGLFLCLSIIHQTVKITKTTKKSPPENVGVGFILIQVLPYLQITISLKCKFI